MQGLTNTTDKHALADGNTELDWEITGDLTVLLRAESSGLGNGRVYTIHIECTDNSQNVAIGWVEITVPYDQGEGKKKERKWVKRVWRLSLGSSIDLVNYGFCAAGYFEAKPRAKIKKMGKFAL